MWKWLLLAIAGCFILFFAVKRDIRYDREYPADLRNRIVGARMIKDGRSPYFYKWHPGDGLRYYDPQNFDTLRPSIMTCTPFLHHLFLPIADWPQSRVSQYWLVIEYALLGLMTLFAWSRAQTKDQQFAVLVLPLIFLFTNAWKAHVWNGQIYLLMPFFALLTTVLLVKLPSPPPIRQTTPGPVRTALAGIAATCLVLIRPNAALFLLPFLLLMIRHWRPARLALFLAPALAAGIYILANKPEQSYWRDYADMVSQQVRVHQELGGVGQHNPPDPVINPWEGVDRFAADSLTHADPIKVYTENGNFFVVFRLLTHRKLSVAMLALSCLLSIGIVLFCWFHWRRPLGRTDWLNTAMLGYCLYMLSDLFSPLYRHQHYEVQWLCPLFLAAATVQRRYWPAYGGILAGLLLGIAHLSFLKMGNTIGEYLILASLLGLSILPERVWPEIQHQRALP